MTGVIRTQLTGLARTLAELKERVRAAVAGELGRAVSGAVQQVVQALVAGPPAYRRPSARWAEDDRDDRWHGHRDPWADDGYDPEFDRAEHPPPDAPPTRAGVAAAVAAGVYAARWWLVRRGTWLAAAGLGLGVGLLGVLGGPAARSAVTALAAAGDILTATDALGAGAACLDSP